MLMRASYEEIDSLSPVELRFRQACQFYVLFKEHHGPSVEAPWKICSRLCRR